jgi:hypothetical protein
MSTTAGTVKVDTSSQAVSDAADQVVQALAEASNPWTFEAIPNGVTGAFPGPMLPMVAATLGGWTGKDLRQERITGIGIRS